MPQPNLVLLTIDCWRGDHFGPLTPHLAALGEESIVFPEAYTAGGWTCISMTAMMSSAYASMHGGTAIGLSTPARRTLAECLLGHGYWTAGFTANPVCGNFGGFQRGFSFFRDVHRPKAAVPSGAPADLKKEWEQFAAMGVPVRETLPFVDANELTDKAIRWLGKRAAGEPFFLWLHYLDPHWPCQMTGTPPAPEDFGDSWQDFRIFRNHVIPARGAFDPGEEMRARWARRYRECLAATDQGVGRLLDALRLRPDWDRTIVAATGDHGEELFERGTWHHSWNQLHREGIHVPLLIRVPGSPPRNVGAPVGLLDLAPTILDLAEIEPPPTMIGKTLRPLAEGKSDTPRPVFTEMMGHVDSALYRLAIREGDWKYIYDFENPHASRLYRTSDDPEERVNLRDSSPGVFRRFEQMRLAHSALGLVNLMDRTAEHPKDAAAAPFADTVPGLSNSDLMQEQLEALGYL